MLQYAQHEHNTPVQTKQDNGTQRNGLVAPVTLHVAGDSLTTLKLIKTSMTVS